MKYAAFIGRWQPWHAGHDWLIRQKLDKGAPVLIMVRDIPPDPGNPFTTEQTISMIEKVYEGFPVKVMSIPDIESVNYGRGVGYEVNEFVPPPDIYGVSATQIRSKIVSGDASWKELVSSRIWDDVTKYLTT